MQSEFRAHLVNPLVVVADADLADAPADQEVPETECDEHGGEEEKEDDNLRGGYRRLVLLGQPAEETVWTLTQVVSRPN